MQNSELSSGYQNVENIKIIFISYFSESLTYFKIGIRDL